LLATKQHLYVLFYICPTPGHVLHICVEEKVTSVLLVQCLNSVMCHFQIKFGSTTCKTEVCRKSLNPQWNSEWYRFEVCCCSVVAW